jgi:hypothetical protein
MKRYEGKWMIIGIESTTRNCIDLVERGYFSFASDGGGSFVLGTVSGNIVCKNVMEKLEFTFEGKDDYAPVSGQGYVAIWNNDKLFGRICFQRGDDSAFIAVRRKKNSKEAHASKIIEMLFHLFSRNVNINSRDVIGGT